MHISKDKKVEEAGPLYQLGGGRSKYNIEKESTEVQTSQK